MVHSLGGGVMVFEVQQNSDVTFRLFDWNHVDPKTGQRRATPGGSGAGLHRFWPVRGRLGRARGGDDIASSPREAFPLSTYFWLSRVRGESPFAVGAAGVPRVLVCIDGKGQLNHAGATYEIGKGDVLLLPAVLGACTFQPQGPVNVLEIEIPE